ncbi:MAG: tRNA uridine-5-carboxymethylaminomethyl(34) synthesis GTPase MnmE [Steroidobacteraceae bacterium]
MEEADTIVAAATPPGRGGVGIVRISGPRVAAIAGAMLGKLPEERRLVLAAFADAAGKPIDIGMAVYFAPPRSYTGEAVLELQGHGGTMVVEALIARALELGARRAEPGEFTQRAFLNDKIDLAQAEAVADLIDAGSVETARAAMRSLQGEFSAMVNGLAEALADLRAYVEAAIDFPEEEIDFLADQELLERLNVVREHLGGVERSAQQGQLLRDGMTVVIAGRPNVGKSSLLNRLAGYDAAIVTDVPGTTRDILRERIHVDGMPLHVLDTAGLRDSSDVVEIEGQRRAHAEFARADRLLFVIDAAVDPDGRAFTEVRERLPRDVPVTLVFNKCDLASGVPLGDTISGPPRVTLSARTGEGLDVLRMHLAQSMGYRAAGEGTVSARRRHVEALAICRQHVEEAELQLRETRAGELVAEELRLAQESLGQITGAISSDELLGRIFASFCVGK